MMAVIALWAVRLALELLMLVAVMYWAASLPVLPALRPVLVMAAVSAAAAVWVAFVAPQALMRVPENARLSIELGSIAAAVAALRATGRVHEALGLGVAAVVVAVVNSLWLRRRDSGNVGATGAR